MRDLVFQFGMEGYGVYNTCLELIAEKIDHNQVPKIKIADRVLRSIVRVSHQKLTKILSFFDQNSLIFSNFDGEYWNLDCPNLLKRLDNWTIRSAVTTEQLPHQPEVKNKKENKKKKKIPAQSAATFEEPVENPKQVSLKDIELKGQDETVKHKIFNQIVDLFTTRGWKTETEYLKRVFKAIVLEMEGYTPKDFFPYFRKVANNYVNKHAELFAADARIVRGQEKKLGLTCAGVTV